MYKLRDLGDSLDGVLARGVGHVMVPTPGTSGYYVDGWCDIASETFLIYSLGFLIYKERTKMMVAKSDWMSTLSLPTPVTRFLAPLSPSVWSLGGQSILAAVGWNWTTTQLHLMLDKVMKIWRHSAFNLKAFLHVY